MTGDSGADWNCIGQQNAYLYLEKYNLKVEPFCTNNNNNTNNCRYLCFHT